MKTLEGIVKNGRVVTPSRVSAADDTRCIVTVLDVTLPAVRRAAKARLSAKKQERLSALLAANKRRRLTKDEEAELDGLLLEVHRLTAERAEAAWVLQQLRRR